MPEVGVQNDLGYQGYAPVASRDTENADIHREQYVNDPQQNPRSYL